MASFGKGVAKGLAAGTQDYGNAIQNAIALYMRRKENEADRQLRESLFTQNLAAEQGAAQAKAAAEAAGIQESNAILQALQSGTLDQFMGSNPPTTERGLSTLMSAQREQRLRAGKAPVPQDIQDKIKSVSEIAFQNLSGIVGEGGMAQPMHILEARSKAIRAAYEMGLTDDQVADGIKRFDEELKGRTSGMGMSQYTPGPTTERELFPGAWIPGVATEEDIAGKTFNLKGEGENPPEQPTPTTQPPATTQATAPPEQPAELQNFVDVLGAPTDVVRYYVANAVGSDAEVQSKIKGAVVRIGQEAADQRVSGSNMGEFITDTLDEILTDQEVYGLDVSSLPFLSDPNMLLAIIRLGIEDYFSTLKSRQSLSEAIDVADTARSEESGTNTPKWQSELLDMGKVLSWPEEDFWNQLAESALNGGSR